MLRLVLAATALLIFTPMSPAFAGCDSIPEAVKDYLRANSEWLLLTDMRNVDDQKDWDRRYPKLCPGVAEGSFYGGESRAYAVALTQRQGTKTIEKVVVVRYFGEKLSERTIVPAFEMHIPTVVLSMPPGTYEDAWKMRKITLGHDSILNAQWEAGADLYYFRGGKFRRLEYEI